MATTPLKLPKLKPRLQKSHIMSTSEFINITGRLDQTNDYRLPINYPVAFEDRTPKYTIYRDQGKHKYMDDILHQANQTMRPGHYHPVDFGRFKSTPKETKFAFNKAARITFVDEINKRET